MAMASKSVERFKHGAQMRQTTDRQTDHAMEKCVVIGRFACAARAMRGLIIVTVIIIVVTVHLIKRQYVG